MTKKIDNTFLVWSCSTCWGGLALPRGVRELSCTVPDLSSAGAIAGPVIVDLLHADGTMVRYR